MDSLNFLPSHNIKLEPACETDHVHSSNKEMTTEVNVFDMVSIKTEPPDVEVEYLGQETPTCSQIVPSLPVQEHSQMEMMMNGNTDCMFVKQEFSDVLCEDKSQRFGKMVDMMNCSNDLKMSEHNNIDPRIIQNSHEALQDHDNCSHISESMSSMFGVNSDFDAPVTQTDHLKTRRRAYTGERPYKCDDCGTSFTQAEHLKIHKRTHTGERPYTCDYCGASFIQTGHLKTHKKIHTGERHYKCDVCDASFSVASNLKRHMRTHTGERPYKCDDCEASFAEAGNLKAHKRIHTGERPYKCIHCVASFAEASSLKNHKRTHTGERPYKCDTCDASFTQAGRLKAHKRTHTGERPYMCSECGDSFTEARNLKAHKRTHTRERL